MQRWSVLHDVETSLDRVAPAFSPEEKAAIAAWAEDIEQFGMHAEIRSGYRFLKEALLLSPGPSGETSWLVHKTPDGAVAVRLWPGLAEIVATVPEALGIIAAALHREWTEGRQPEGGSPSAAAH